ncbi:Response regulator receiver domain-containing protein [Zobellia uliginosa]|uniref:Response regulator receiver domain-containing protein n=1 Tax=Zobellia uliginosa TaxID=143224 RepID=A0ABY1KVL3_9FLAO|nr:response regulator [Zobellia uliginosa]SIS74259.1 Response regulator receiver domain-containing protein [Zobellia uliginosa]
MQSPFHLCIIDDDDIYRFTIIQSAKFLEIEHKTSVFVNGEDALNFILENQNNPAALPDIILLDIDMPVMDGFQFLEEYKAIDPKINRDIKIYMVSSSVDPEDIAKAKSYSMVVDYISKPLTPENLKQLVADI